MNLRQILNQMELALNQTKVATDDDWRERSKATLANRTELAARFAGRLSAMDDILRNYIDRLREEIGIQE